MMDSHCMPGSSSRNPNCNYYDRASGQFSNEYQDSVRHYNNTSDQTFHQNEEETGAGLRVMNRADESDYHPHYQERFKIGLEDADPDFNAASKVIGEGGNNLRFIYNETGATVTVRGRGSGYIEPRTGRESSDPLHIVVEHESSYDNFKEACGLSQDLIKAVREDWYKLRNQLSQHEGHGEKDFFCQRERNEENEARYSVDYQRDETCNSNCREVLQVYSGDQNNMQQNDRDQYDVHRGPTNKYYERESDVWGRNEWDSCRDDEGNVSDNKPNNHRVASLESLRKMGDEEIRAFHISGKAKKRLSAIMATGIGFIEAKRQIIEGNYARANRHPREINRPWVLGKRWEEPKRPQQVGDTPPGTDNEGNINSDFSRQRGRDSDTERQWGNRSQETRDYGNQHGNNRRENTSEQVWSSRGGSEKMEKRNWRASSSGQDGNGAGGRNWSRGEEEAWSREGNWDNSYNHDHERNTRNETVDNRSYQWNQLQNFRTQKDKNREQMHSENKKLRWDMSSSNEKSNAFVSGNNVSRDVLGRKKFEEKHMPTKFRNPGDFQFEEDLMNYTGDPQQMNQGGMQYFNRRQSSEANQQQQSLHMPMISSLSQQKFPGANHAPKDQGNLIISNTSNSFNDFQSFSPPSFNSFPAMPNQCEVSETWETHKNDYTSNSAMTSNSSEIRRDQFGQNNSSGDKKWGGFLEPWADEQIFTRQRPSEGGKGQSSFGRNERNRHSNERQIRQSRNPSFSRQSSNRMRLHTPRHSTSFRQVSPEHHRGNDRYSPQLNDEQDRYSPQLEDNIRVSPELFVGREEYNSNKPSDNRNKQPLRFRVAVIDKKFNKLSPQDENEIRNFICKELNCLPSKKYDIDFVGFGSHNYIYILMPHTLDSMNWLLNKLFLKTLNRHYIVFPYEDIYNRFKVRTTLFFDILEGYKPTSEEVILELGRINNGLCTEMWKTIKFCEEGDKFFMMISIDFLSYLQLRKIKWKPKYRISTICLQPCKNEKGIDERFNRK